MLVTDSNKIVLHMPKCGGSSVRWALIKAGYKYRFGCEHAPIYLLPEKYKDLPRIAFIRNPIEWYKSWYNYLKYKKEHGGTSNIFAHVLSNGFKDSIDTFIYNSMNIGSYFNNDDNFNRLKKRIQVVCMNNSVCWHNFTWDDVEDISKDEFTGTLFNYEYNLIGLNTAKVYRIEDGIQDSLIKEFNNNSIKVGMYNVTPNKNNNPNLNQKSKELIYKHDKYYFDLFNYHI